MNRRDESGIALVTVLIAVFVLLALAVTVIDYASTSRDISKHDQNWNAALNAAEAGVDDYLFHLNENSNYTDYGAANPPPDGNKAFNQFVDVPGGSTPSQFEYSADTSNLTIDGTVTITSTGKVKTSKRTIQSILRRRNFLDYLYFTDYETKDPATYTGSPFTAAQAQTLCALHYYDGRDSRCTEIDFIGADTINGPMHTNDAFKVCGSAQFRGGTTTSWNPATGKRWRDDCPTSTPSFSTSGDPAYKSPLAMPPSNSALRSQTSSANGGCLYTGPTRIRLTTTGQMTVKSPFSKDTHNGCPTNGTGSLPRNGVIYVQNVPSTSTDANYTAGCPYNVNGQSHPLGLPIGNDVTSYGCRNGDAFLEGTLKGALTIAADNNIDITWNLTYNGGLAGRDLLGLVANNYVEIWHPVRCTSGTGSTCNLDANFPGESSRGNPFSNPNVQAAILSVNHSFRVQNYNVGAPLGSITLDGTIGQRYRGAVGTFSGTTIATGYGKNYRYDRRMKYLAPPKFLDPVASAWAIAVWKEIANP
ncbi:MAG: pilus assembly PilX N-terminal domain-containing protein [Acidimicrobiia bacterium]